jgi:two-component system, NarL family, sensor histidine kinase DegS
MNAVVLPTKLGLNKASKILINPHLWLLLALIIIIAIPYYFDFTSLRNRAEWIWQLRIIEYVCHINGILIVLPLIYAALVFGWIGALVVWGFSFSVVFPSIIYFSNGLTSLLNNILLLVVPIIIIILVMLIMKWGQRERQIYRDREAERQTYMQQVLQAQEDERKSIASELHDGTIQTLFVLSNDIQGLLEDNNGFSPAVNNQMESFRDTVTRMSEDLRRLCVKLRPSILDNIGLMEALRWLVDNINGKNIQAQLLVYGDNRKLGSSIEVMIFRFVQEALSNVKKHSGATKVTVEMNFAADAIKICIVDNGKGFTVPKPIGKFALERKLGLLDMQERANLLNGNFDINSRPGEGTVISLELKV